MLFCSRQSIITAMVVSYIEEEKKPERKIIAEIWKKIPTFAAGTTAQNRK